MSRTPTNTPVATATRTPTRTLTITPTRTRTPLETGARVSYIGAIDDDGCPFCCTFACQNQPTPTPAFDPQGRQIFVRPNGQFLFVIEGARGTSNREPGEKLEVSGAERPDVQVLVSRNLGDGSTIACDKGPAPQPLGGVPGITPQDFGPESEVTTALQDFACRLAVQKTSGDACTRNRFGLFSFIAPTTRKQFCLAVPRTTAFPVGDTIVALQLLDTQGNVGPRKEIVIRVDP